MIKDIHCSYCGRVIYSVTIAVSENAHIQKLELNGACDQCSKPTLVSFDVGELDAKRQARIMQSKMKAQMLINESQRETAPQNELV